MNAKAKYLILREYEQIGKIRQIKRWDRACKIDTIIDDLSEGKHVQEKRIVELHCCQSGK